jgi:tetratricopeptide (TPR) repeat protein
VLSRHVESVRRKLERKGRATEVGQAHEATYVENKPGSSADGSGPATLMSRLMREELNREKRGTPLGRAFNSVWVLLPLALLCLGVIVWTFWPASPETLFERGAELMKSKSLADKERAWREYLEPLEKEHPDHPYQKEVAELRKQLEAARKGEDETAAPSIGEAQRLCLLGELLQLQGKSEEARRLWSNLVAAFKDVESEKAWVRRAEAELAKLDNAAVARKRWEPVRAALKQAAELRDQGKRAEAERIWSAVEALYGQDPAAWEILGELRAARKKKE